MTNPTNPDRGAAGGGTNSAGASVGRSGRDTSGPGPASPWSRTTRSGDGTDNETSSLPQVGGADPYSKPGTMAKSSIDHYAALTAADARSVAAATGQSRFEPAGPTYPPPVGPPSVPQGGPGAPGTPGGLGPDEVPTVAKAKAIRPPKNARPTPRRAKLQVRHLNVWSVLRFSCVLAIALFFVWLIMIGVLYGILDVTHVFSKVNDTVRTINGDDTTKDVVTPGIVFGGAFVIGLVNIVLFIALTTIGSIVYNLCADLVGGIEVTLSEHE